MEVIEGGAAKPERDWRQDVTLDGQKFTRDVIDSFNRQFDTSKSRIPLINYEGAVKEHYILLLMQLFAHIFTGLAGSDPKTEENFINDMKHWFASARMENLKIQEASPNGPPPSIA